MIFERIEDDDPDGFHIRKPNREHLFIVKDDDGSTYFLCERCGKKQPFYYPTLFGVAIPSMFLTESNAFIAEHERCPIKMSEPEIDRIALLAKLINRERMAGHREAFPSAVARQHAEVWSKMLDDVPTDRLEVRFQQARAARKEQSNFPIGASEIAFVNNKMKHGWFWHAASFEWFNGAEWTLVDGELKEITQ